MFTRREKSSTSSILRRACYPACGLESLESRTLFNVGDLNLAFGGGNGRELISRPVGTSVSMSLATQPDGKFVLASGSTGSHSIWMERLDAKGNLDTTFGSKGIVTQTISNLVSTTGIARQSDGKFVVIGTTTTGGFIARFTSSGKLDSTFGTHGVVQSGLYVQGVAILPNGDIAAASSAHLIELKTNGARDKSFGQNGSFSIVSAASGLTKFTFAGIAAQKDNKIVLDGTGLKSGQSFTSVSILRLTTSGKLDTSFAGTGLTQIPPASGDNEIAIGMAIDSNGRIIAAGDDDNYGYFDAFDTKGANVLSVNVGYTSGADITGMSVDSSNRILVIGYSDQAADWGNDFSLRRYNPDGSEDFETRVDFSGPTGFRDDFGAVIAATSDGNILVLGTSTPSSSISSPTGPNAQVAIASIQGNPGGPRLPTVEFTGDAAGDIVFNGTGGNDTLGIYDYGEDSWVDFQGYISERFLVGNNNFVINGGGGNDLITFATDQTGDYATNHATLNGGSGNDTLVDEGLGDVLQGGSGTDTADFSSRTENLSISLDNKANDGFPGQDDNVMADVENIIGGSGNDLIIGNPFNNNLQGGSGNDTIWGGAGNDTLTGGSGRDYLNGQEGNDIIYAKDGRTDTVDGGSGTDKAQVDKSASITDVVTHVESFF